LVAPDALLFFATFHLTIPRLPALTEDPQETIQTVAAKRGLREDH